jgi:hypothetical protein
MTIASARSTTVSARTTTVSARHLGRAAVVLLVAMAARDLFGQPVAPDRNEQVTIRGTERQEKIWQVLGNKAAYAAAIVARWEGAAREAGRWDESYPADLLESLVKLDPENLLAAGEASSYQAMMTVLATGRAEPAVDGPVPGSLGQNFQDLVYTPVAPCRIVDTRTAVAGALAAGVARTFDVDGSNLGEQGGKATGCGIPLAVAQAVTMTIVAVQPANRGYLTAWGLGERPTPSSVLNYAANDVVANTAIVPVVPGGGDDFTLFSLATTHVVVDVLGYFAASNATRLDCTTVPSDIVAVPVDEITAVDASCPPGREATGGGYDIAEGTIAFTGLFMTSNPLANGWRTLVENHTGGPRAILTFARCCRIPGR